jgi:hypothetical protein
MSVVAKASTATASVATLKQRVPQPAKVCDAWFIESLRKNASPEMETPVWGYEFKV